jgi:hypothetical protein
VADVAGQETQVDAEAGRRLLPAQLGRRVEKDVGAGRPFSQAFCCISCSSWPAPQPA